MTPEARANLLDLWEKKPQTRPVALDWIGDHWAIGMVSLETDPEEEYAELLAIGALVRALDRHPGGGRSPLGPFFDQRESDDGDLLAELIAWAKRYPPG